MATAIAAAQWQALSTTVVLRLTDPRALEEAHTIVSDLLAHLDRTCSRFRPDSDLSRVNGSRGRAVRVDPLLIEALEVALRAAELTAGEVDPTIGRALELAGYDRDWLQISERTVVQPEPILAAHVRRGWQTVALDRAGSMVRVPDGIHLDLGATAKAWAADRAARAVAERTGSGVLVGLGGDISTAGTPPPGGWQIHVTDDHRDGPQAPGQRVSISDGGLATSSTAARRWVKAGKAMHHIIDPATCEPVRGGWRTVSVAARNATDANIASTAALIRAERAPQWLEQLGLPARLVAEDGGVRTTAGWPTPAKDRIDR
ncbi:MAG TPA: FAD:protein FMN transferase [Solirubrobacteraceae bacterium]|jgi:thiamine biosynthesis lipoprotein